MAVDDRARGFCLRATVFGGLNHRADTPRPTNTWGQQYLPVMVESASIIAPGCEGSQSGAASRLRCKERDVVELGSPHLHHPTPPPAEEGKHGQARGEEGEGRGLGDGYRGIDRVNQRPIRR